MSEHRGSLSDFNKYEKRIKKWYPKLEQWIPFLAYRLAAYLFFKPFRFASPKAEYSMVKKARGYSFKSQGKELQAYKWGSGPVVAFVHGWSGRGLQVHAMVSPLIKAGFEVIAFDAVGHGLSPGSTADIVSFTEAIKSLVKDQGQIYALIGHSLGGGACLLAAKQGIPVGKLVIISTPAIAVEIKEEFLKRIGASEATGQYLEKYIKQRQGKSLEEYSARNSAAEGFPDIPVQLIYDEDDTDVPLHHGQELLKLLPNAQIKVTQKLGHLRILRSDEVIETILKFLTK